MTGREALRKAMTAMAEMIASKQVQVVGREQADLVGGELVVVCSRNHADIVGSKQARCECGCGCNAMVWLSPATQEMLAKRTAPAMLLCLECVTRQFAGSERPVAAGRPN